MPTIMHVHSRQTERYTFDKIYIWQTMNHAIEREYYAGQENHVEMVFGQIRASVLFDIHTNNRSVGSCTSENTQSVNGMC